MKDLFTFVNSQLYQNFSYELKKKNNIKQQLLLSTFCDQVLLS